MPRRRRSLAIHVLAIGALLATLVGCSSVNSTIGPTAGPGSTPRGTSAPTPVPSSTLPPGSVEHATGATDLVLRFEESGGFVAPGFLVTEGPGFSLYGDGTVIFRDSTATPPNPIGTVQPQVPYQIARLTEEQVQTLLAFAVGPGGLGGARATYELPIADAPTAVFTIHAGGTQKTVSVNGLGIGAQSGGPDSLILGQLASLRTRLQGFGAEIAGEQVWSPDRYRGILTEDAFNPPAPWPWKDIAPADFVVVNAPNAPGFPIRTMSPADVARLGVVHLDGGVRGFTFLGPDGKTYGFSLRPLLPDETN